MEDAIFSYIINKHDLIIKIKVYIGIFLICLLFLVITDKFKDKKQLYYQIKKSGISWKKPIRDISKNEQQSIYKNRVKEGYSTENMKNKISFIYIRINNKLIDSYANYILDMPKSDNK